MTELKTTKENVLKEAEQSPLARAILSRLHPEAFEKEFKRISITINIDSEKELKDLWNRVTVGGSKVNTLMGNKFSDDFSCTPLFDLLNAQMFKYKQ